MSNEAEFLPAERLSASQVRAQADEIGANPVLTAMLDTAPSIIALLNPQRQIVFCNDACVRAGGLSGKEDALGMRFGELLGCVHAYETPGGCGTSESCRYCGAAHAIVIAKKGSPHSGECLMHCEHEGLHTSTEYAVEVRPLPQLGAGWQSCSLTDISDEKRRQALEHTFFHDIMNRASAVEGVSEVLADTETSVRDRDEFIGMLSFSSRALVEEIRSQRTLLAAEKNELAVERADCNSRDLLVRAAAVCRPFGLAEDKHVAILPDAVSVRFSTDATLLGRVLINMLKNALEASKPGSVITATCSSPLPNRVRFSVHNETAMPDNVRAHVFQRSFSTRGPGRGLGTYSIKLLTEVYLGGHAWFESAAGLGTTFHTEFAV